eukprot:scaffold5025_cov145-Amphora_coffeaeformis.AAC.7
MERNGEKNNPSCTLLISLSFISLGVLDWFRDRVSVPYYDWSFNGTAGAIVSGGSVERKRRYMVSGEQSDTVTMSSRP